MIKKNVAYLVLVFCLTNLHYNEYWGLNALISAILFVLFSGLAPSLERKLTDRFKLKWWLAVFLFLGNAYAVFSTGNQGASYFYFISLLYFIAVDNEINVTFPYSILKSTLSFFEGFYNLTNTIGNRFDKKETNEPQTPRFRNLIYIIPVFIVIIFLKLYQMADETFYEYTKFINLDWISWPFIALFCILFIFLYGFTHYTANELLNTSEKALKSNIPETATDQLHKFMGRETETRVALLLLITLNLLLFAYILFDFRVIFVDLPNPEPTFRYSKFLHTGVNSLIMSIILVIVLISVIFRGQLNFLERKNIKRIAQLWMLLNLVMVGTTVVKNYAYIEHWGLTYKRIGVYIYLLLAAIGLVLTLIKIQKIQTTWTLIRHTLVGFLICFTINGFFNWDRTIVNYNLHELDTKSIDFNYLISLKDEAYPGLINYYASAKSTSLSESEWQAIFTDYYAKLIALRKKENTSSWRSMTLYETDLLKRMEACLPIYKSFNKL